MLEVTISPIHFPTQISHSISTEVPKLTNFAIHCGRLKKRGERPSYVSVPRMKALQGQPPAPQKGIRNNAVLASNTLTHHPCDMIQDL